MKEMINYIRLMRPKHYLKNVLVLVPLFFDRKLFDLDILLHGIGGFIAFSLLASAVYIINDIRDIPYDRRNEKKCSRPLASGAVSKKNAWMLAVILLVCVIGLTIGMGDIHWRDWKWLLFYLCLNLAYSFKWKNIPIVDVLILSLGYVIRILYGGGVTGSSVSYWLYMTVLTGTLYMAFGKRRNEFMQGEKRGDVCRREVLKFYNCNFLDKNMYMFMGMAIMFYALWCGDEKTLSRVGNSGLIWTVPIVIALAMRYSLDIEADDWADPIEVILNDKGMIALGIVYVAGMFGIIYWF